MIIDFKYLNLHNLCILSLENNNTMNSSVSSHDIIFEL